MPDLIDRRIDAWTACNAEPAVRAAERAIVTESGAVLDDTLKIAAAAESRRRLAHVLDLKDRAERDPSRRDAYQRAADDLRNWAADVYLAIGSESRAQRVRLGHPNRGPAVKHTNPFSEESISLRRSVPRRPFPGQPGRAVPAAPQETLGVAPA